MANNMDRVAITTWTLWQPRYLKRDVWRRQTTSEQSQKSQWISIPFLTNELYRYVSDHIYIYIHIYIYYTGYIDSSTNIFVPWLLSRMAPQSWLYGKKADVLLGSSGWIGPYISSPTSKKWQENLHVDMLRNSISMHFYAFFIISSWFFSGSFWGKTGRSSAWTFANVGLNSGTPWHRHWCSGRPTTRGRQRLRWEFRKLSYWAVTHSIRSVFTIFSHYFFMFLFVLLLGDGSSITLKRRSPSRLS